MIPKLYQKDGTTLIGNLTNCIKCLVEEERNGIFEVTLQYPNNETISTSLVYDNIIICDSNDTLKNQKFRIYDTRRMMNNTIEVYARHISFDLAYDYINSIDITNQSCEYALNTIFRSSQFSTGYVGHSDIVNAQNYKISNCNALEAIAGKQGSIIDTYGTGAEILRDNTDIHVLNRRGNDNKVSIEYAKNLTGFELQENTDDLITRIIPFATYTPEGGQQTRVQGSTIDSQYINNYSHPFIAELDFSDKFEDNEVPTPAKLNTMAQLYFEENKCDLPKQNWKIEFIPLSKCVGYESIEDAISLCDTVTIKDTRYNINTKAKVIKTVYDVLRERYDSMELGEPRTTLGDIVNTGNEKGEQGPPGPQGPKGEDGNIGDFPDSVPAKPVLTTTLLGFASIQLDWTYDNKPYYWYEVYASKTKDFTPNLFDIVHKGQTSSFLFQAKPGETWYFRVCGVNSYDHRSEFSDQIEVITAKVDNLSNYFTTAAIGQAVVGSFTADYMQSKIIKGQWIDAKNLSVTDGNGKRTLDIDSFGNVNLDVNSISIRSQGVATVDSIKSSLTDSSIQYYLSTSLTSLIGGSWQDIAPEWTQGKYMWQRMKYTKYDGSITYGEAVCIAGAKGDTGEKGQSLVSSTPQWYLSTSATSQIGGSWTNTMPTITNGKYMWTRFKNVWENPDKTTYTTPILEQLGEAIKDVVIKQAEFTQDLDGFKTTVSETYATKNQLNSVDGKFANYSTTTEVESIVNQKADEINSTVSYNYATKADLDGIKNGKNLIKNSNFISDKEGWRFNYAEVDSTKKLDNSPSAKIRVYGEESYSSRGIRQDFLENVKKDEEFAVSFWYYVEDKSTFDSDFVADIDAQIHGDSYMTTMERKTISRSNLVEGAWTRVTFTFKLSNDCDYLRLYLYLQMNGTIWITNIQVERGSQATEWTPSATDFNAELEIIRQEVSTVSQTASSLTTEVSKKLNSADLSSRIQQSATDIKIGFNGINNYISISDSMGIRVNHTDGSYSRINEDGFLYYNSGTERRYHCLYTAGTIQLTGSGENEKITITLPAVFSKVKASDIILILSMDGPRFYASPGVYYTEYYSVSNWIDASWRKDYNGNWSTNEVSGHYRVYNTQTKSIEYAKAYISYVVLA